ncbi:MAG: AraC family transcriptional regulator [Desulfobacteraceae bacterium]|jgi:AraC-like DNA-binding protein
MQKIQLRPGLSFHIADFKPRATLKRDFEIHDACLRFTFYLEGSGRMERSLSTGTAITKKVIPIERSSSISYFPEREGRICFPAGHRQSHLAVLITPSLLNTFTGGRFRRIPYDLEAISQGCRSIDFYHSGPLSPVMTTTVHRLLNCPYAGPLGQIYQESKAVELIAHKLAQIQASTSTLPGSNQLRLDDIERIYLARKILIHDLENPPRLFDLARAAGTTHTQLNRGFRRIYGTSVFGYLRKMRLEKARDLLEKEGMNVTEAAFAVGYNSLSSFSRAFSAHFGCRPVHCRRRVTWS